MYIYIFNTAVGVCWCLYSAYLHNKLNFAFIKQPFLIISDDIFKGEFYLTVRKYNKPSQKSTGRNKASLKLNWIQNWPVSVTFPPFFLSALLMSLYHMSLPNCLSLCYICSLSYIRKLKMELEKKK